MLGFHSQANSQTEPVCKWPHFCYIYRTYYSFYLAGAVTEKCCKMCETVNPGHKPLGDSICVVTTEVQWLTQSMAGAAGPAQPYLLKMNMIEYYITHTSHFLKICLKQVTLYPSPNWTLFILQPLQITLYLVFPKHNSFSLHILRPGKKKTSQILGNFPRQSSLLLNNLEFCVPPFTTFTWWTR